MSAIQNLTSMVNSFLYRQERQRRRKVMDIRLATVLTLVLKFPVTTALLYGQEVHYNYDRGANFSAYKTYQWIDSPSGATRSDPTGTSQPPAGNQPLFPPLPSLPGNPPIPPGGMPRIPAGAADIRDNSSEDQLINQEIKRAIDEQLAQKGLTRVENWADLKVSYHAAIRQEQSLFLSGAGWGNRGWGGAWDGSLQGQTSSVPIGTIVVDLYDPAHDQLIWRGDATKTIDLKKDPDKNYKNLQKAMAKLFQNYPPRPKR